MSQPERVLIVEDQVGDIAWLIESIQNLGYGVDLSTSESAARERLQAVKKGEVSYVMAIFDIMVATVNIWELEDLDEDFFARSEETGIRLCKLVREEMKISEEQLPIVCFTVREDEEEVRSIMRDLNIPLFNKMAPTRADSIWAFLEKRLPRVGES